MFYNVICVGATLITFCLHTVYCIPIAKLFVYTNKETKSN